MSDFESLVDLFIERVNTEPRETQAPEDVPQFLRGAVEDLDSESSSIGWASWKIVKRDNSTRIDELQRRTGRAFPPSFRYLVSNYAFPAFECGPLLFFANTGEDTFWELEARLFNDPHMSPALLQAGFVQIGNPFFYNYDPVCFDCNPPGLEKRIVQVDHEEILCNDRVQTVREIAPSFPHLLRALLRDWPS